MEGRAPIQNPWPNCLPRERLLAVPVPRVGSWALVVVLPSRTVGGPDFLGCSTTITLHAFSVALTGAKRAQCHSHILL